MDTELADQPALRAQDLLIIGQTYSDIGLLDEAERALREAVSISTRLYGEGNKATTTSMISLAVPLAMPTFFEMPLALILLAAGLPAGAAITVLIAGPATNLPSLFTVARSTGWKVPALVAASVWALAVLGGLIAG